MIMEQGWRNNFSVMKLGIMRRRG